MQHFHAIVWVDHREAKIYEFNADDVQKFVIHSHSEPAHHIHHKAGSIGSGHTTDDHAFFAAIAKALEPVGEILLVGPSTAKTALAEFLQSHDKSVAFKVVGIENADHPSDGEVVNYARKYFRAKDRMQPQRTSKPG
ncbi:MAG: translational machinery protein [Alphaproteobacteria bacterium]|nr:translational machinery protein [Alphaproteobacteria bacterium]